MYLVSLQGHGTSSSPSASGIADRVHAGDELAVVAQHLERLGAHPGHDPHRDRHVGASRSAARRCARSASRCGPIEKGTTYIVRPFIEPLNRPPSSSRISAGSRQLLVGPASCSRSVQMKVRSSTRATSLRRGTRQVGVWPLRLGELVERARVDQLLARGGRTPPRSRRTSGSSRAAVSAAIPRPRRSARRAWSVPLRRRRVHSRVVRTPWSRYSDGPCQGRRMLPYTRTRPAG